jgi:sulfur-oxidizing protein SoxX
MAPDLAGVGARWSSAQLRLRIVDGSRLNPETIMPSYYRIEGLNRVAPAFKDAPILNAQQVEDVVAFLKTLQDPSANPMSNP